MLIKMHSMIIHHGMIDLMHLFSSNLQLKGQYNNNIDFYSTLSDKINISDKIKSLKTMINQHSTLKKLWFENQIYSSPKMVILINCFLCLFVFVFIILVNTS